MACRMDSLAICIFCGNSAKLTREHVLPQWFTSLPPGEGPFTIRRVAEAGDTVEYTAIGAEIVVRAVCGNCNNGWMAGLEATVKQLVSRMINGERQPLTPHDQTIISRWAVKTAVMFLYATKPPVGVSPAHRSHLHGGKVPPNTGVWLARYRAEPPAYNSWIRARQIEMRLRTQPQVTHLGQAVTLTLGYYVQHVLLTPAAWFTQDFRFNAPQELKRCVLQVPADRAAVWPPPYAVSTQELQQYVDLFGATGIDTPASKRAPDLQPTRRQLRSSG